MKKIALTSLMALFVVSAANAGNYFVGGSAGLDTAKDSGTVYNLDPEFGYHMNDKWDIGFEVGFAKWTYDDINHRNISIAPFARYEVAKFGGLEVLLKGSVGADFNIWSQDGDSETVTSLYASVVPMVTYDISESFTLFAELNFLGMRASQQLSNDTVGIKDDWSFNVFGNTNDVLNTEDFQIGFTYNF